MKIQDDANRIQACGSFDPKTGEYSFSLAGGHLAVSFDFLSKDDVEHIVSCLSCLLLAELPD